MRNSIPAAVEQQTPDPFYVWLEANGRDHQNPAVRVTWQMFFWTIGRSRARTQDGMRRAAERWSRNTNWMLHQFDAAVGEWQFPREGNVVSLVAYRAVRMLEAVSREARP